MDLFQEEIHGVSQDAGGVEEMVHSQWRPVLPSMHPRVPAAALQIPQAVAV